MKRLVSILTILIISNFLSAQDCEYFKNGKTVKVNDMSIRINTDGTLFHINEEGHFINPDLGPGSPTTIRKAGFCIGGFEGGTNVLKVASTGFTGDAASDFFPGPLMPDQGTIYTDVLCNYMNQVWTVKREDIQLFLEDYYYDGVLDTPIPSIINWPGNGNPHFQWGDEKGLPDRKQGWAPFADRNHDGIYDPYDGDYPIAGSTHRLPKEIYWTVYNDEGGGAFHDVTNGDALRVEVQFTGWAVECPDLPWMEDYFFTEYRIINQALTDLDSLHAGIWVDFNLGCAEDDYVGSSPKFNSFYAYNADNYDGEEEEGCTFDETSYENYSPVMSVSFLWNDMSSFMYFNKDDSLNINQGRPKNAAEFYNYLTGRWEDATPLTYGGTGYNPGSTDTQVKFAFPDQPDNAEGWSMQSENFPTNEVYALGSIKPTFVGLNPFQRGSVWRFNVAYGYHHSHGRERLDLVDWSLNYGAKNAIQIVDDFYTVSRDYPCSCPNTLDERLRIESVNQDEKTFELYPNPTNGKITLKYTGGKAQVLAIYNVAHEMVLFDNNIEADGRIDFDMSGFHEGIYFVRLIVDGETFEERLILF